MGGAIMLNDKKFKPSTTGYALMDTWLENNNIIYQRWKLIDEKLCWARLFKQSLLWKLSVVCFCKLLSKTVLSLSFPC